MDEKTRKKVLDKAASMISYISYPDELLDDKKLDEFYEKLELSADDYFGSFLNFSIFEMNYLFGRLRIPVDETEWITHGGQATVRAAYSQSKNSIRTYKYLTINKDQTYL